MSRRKQHHEEHQDERWLITYADMLTLMFVLFMVLFSISVVNTGKFEQLKESLSKAFSSGLFSGGESVVEQGAADNASPVAASPASSVDPQIPTALGINLANAPAAAGLESRQLEDAKEAVEDAARRAGISQQVSATVDERGLQVRLRTEPFLFDSGSATLRPQAARVLAPLAVTIGRLPNPVVVEGHTDSRPIHTAQFPSNWWLGGGRACAVLEVLARRGIPAARMSCASRGDTQPVEPNDTEAHRAANRRVEILVLRTQDPTAAPATP